MKGGRCRRCCWIDGERERVGAGTECEGDIYRYYEKDKNRGGERERESVREGRYGDDMECEALSIWDAP